MCVPITMAGRVVLQCNNTLHRTGLGVNEDDAAFKQAGGSRGRWSLFTSIACDHDSSVGLFAAVFLKALFAWLASAAWYHNLVGLVGTLPTQTMDVIGP